MYELRCDGNVKTYYVLKIEICSMKKEDEISQIFFLNCWSDKILLWEK